MPPVACLYIIHHAQTNLLHTCTGTMYSEPTLKDRGEASLKAADLLESTEP